jgi:hypothetical protein
MPIFSGLIFTAVRWSARRGLRDSGEAVPQSQNQAAHLEEKFQHKEKARRRGLLGETYGYWYLRKQGYVFIAKNYMPAPRANWIWWDTMGKLLRSWKSEPAPFAKTSLGCPS